MRFDDVPPCEAESNRVLVARSSPDTGRSYLRSTAWHYSQALWSYRRGPRRMLSFARRVRCCWYFRFCSCTSRPLPVNDVTVKCAADDC